MGALQFGLTGDRADPVPAHRAIQIALPLAREALQHSVEFDRLATDAIACTLFQPRPQPQRAALSSATPALVRSLSTAALAR